MKRVNLNYLLNLINEIKLERKEFFMVLSFVFLLVLLGSFLSFVFNLIHSKNFFIITNIVT